VMWWHNNKINDANWVNAQQRYCAGSWLDHIRDASLITNEVTSGTKCNRQLNWRWRTYTTEV
jgi:hypothetical protein